MSARSEDAAGGSATPPDIIGFATALYGQPGVADACLLLQDRCDADVCVVLALCWAARNGNDVSDRDTLARLTDASADWRTNVVLPLRGARRWLKPRADTAARGELRGAIKKAELSAEFIELEMLGSVLAPPGPTHPPASPETLARAIEAYLQPSGGADPVVAKAVQTIAAAALSSQPN